MVKAAAKQHTVGAPVVGPKLRKLLFVVFFLAALLACNALYLAAVTLFEYLTAKTYQDLVYQYMFLVHLALGVALVLPMVIYGVLHIRNAHARPNRRAVRVGYGLFATALLLLISGLVLTSGIPLIEVRHPQARSIAYWLHVITPMVAAWLFVLHRLAGKPINWKFGTAVAFGAIALAALGLLTLLADPRAWGRVGPASGEQYFFPSLARTASGGFIPAERLMTDDYCAECHADVHAAWSVSAHRFASFNNPAYLFTVRQTRAKMLARDGTVNGARFCAGCHDLVPFFSGAFDDPTFDDINHPTAQAGITCTGCHAITHINSVRGNADYTIEEPLYYPFTFSNNTFLAWLNRTLVKAKPAFHKKTFLKPLHGQATFCAACHKVHLPPELNAYRWLRGQNHYDSYHLSGVSGHGVASFYYPAQAEPNCNGCHMAWRPSRDLGARLDPDGVLAVHDHQFLGANTALPQLLNLPASAIQRQREFLAGVVRLDIFGLRASDAIDAPLFAPLPENIPTLRPQHSYLLEVVVRTMKLGHAFTEGTADSNEVWLELKVTDANGRLLGMSGSRDAKLGTVDPRAHFLNAWVVDREGNRIDARQAEDIFSKLYDHQIPPGAADVVHYRLTLPVDFDGPLTITAALHYRKFDSTYMQAFQGSAFSGNDLPITTIAQQRVTLGVDANGSPAGNHAAPEIADWMRWNDYGIGLLRKPEHGQLRQAEAAFLQVAALGRPEGWLNLGRVYLREGRLAEAEAVLTKAAQSPSLETPWVATWLSAELNFQNGYLEATIAALRELVETPYPNARARGFDFSQDYRLLERLAQALFEHAKTRRDDPPARSALLADAERWYRQALMLEPERASSHYGLALALSAQGKQAQADAALALHDRYKIDDNARDRALAAARRKYPAAHRSAQAVAIYDLDPAPYQNQ